jgi:hypothetical protein
MYPNGWKQQFMQLMAVVLVASYVIHLAAAWLGAIAPTALALLFLAGICAVLFRWWRR